MNTENNKITHKFTFEEHCKLVSKDGDVQSLFVKQHVYEVSQEQIDNFFTKAFQMGAEVLLKLIRNQGVGGETPASESIQQTNTEQVQHSEGKTRIEDFINEMQLHKDTKIKKGLLYLSDWTCNRDGYLENVEKWEFCKLNHVGRGTWERFLSLREQYYEKMKS